LNIIILQHVEFKRAYLTAAITGEGLLLLLLLFLIYPILPAALCAMALGLTHPLTEIEYQECSGGGGGMAGA
jgi:hypothetical protein